jgi:uncharacterized protein YutD
MLFYYDQVRNFEKKKEDGTSEPLVMTVKECFNITKVIRAYWDSPEKFVVILDDGHEQAENKTVPIFDNKGKIKSAKVERVREWYCSMISLSPSEADEFQKITSVNHNFSGETFDYEETCETDCKDEQ